MVQHQGVFCKGKRRMSRDYHSDKDYNNFIGGCKTSIDEQNRVLALILDDIADSLRKIAQVICIKGEEE